MDVEEKRKELMHGHQGDDIEIMIHVIITWIAELNVRLDVTDQEIEKIKSSTMRYHRHIKTEG